ncbi:MAG: hypothetical protein LC720_04350 [Actinobacteria bacterium]|nr:hypothetical protein [Actinomycetota bacterium]
MADLALKGTLNLTGVLDLVGAQGGKVTAGGAQVLIVGATGTAPPVILPPPPADPLNPNTDVKVFVSFNQTVTASGAAIVTQGVCLEGGPAPVPWPWPGMVQPSIGNATVMVNHVPMNVVGDQATILPTGAPAVLTSSGQ